MLVSSCSYTNASIYSDCTAIYFSCTAQLTLIRSLIPEIVVDLSQHTRSPGRETRLLWTPCISVLLHSRRIISSAECRGTVFVIIARLQSRFSSNPRSHPLPPSYSDARLPHQRGAARSIAEAGPLFAWRVAQVSILSRRLHLERPCTPASTSRAF